MLLSDPTSQFRTPDGLGSYLDQRYKKCVSVIILNQSRH